jgi:hypothetical protein
MGLCKLYKNVFQYSLKSIRLGNTTPFLALADSRTIGRNQLANKL